MSGGLDIPDAVKGALPQAARATAYLRVRAGLDSLLGETHLFVIDGALAVVVQTSMLAPPAPLRGPVKAELEVGSLRSVLRVAHADGAGTVTLGYGEDGPVRALLDALAESARRADEAPAIEVGESDEETPPSDPEPAAEADPPPPPRDASPREEPREAAPPPATEAVFTLPPFAPPAPPLAPVEPFAPAPPLAPGPPLAPALLGALAGRDVAARSELLSVLAQRSALLEDAERAEARGRARELAALARARRVREDEEQFERAQQAEATRRAAQAALDPTPTESRRARRRRQKRERESGVAVRADGSLRHAEAPRNLEAQVGTPRGLPTLHGGAAGRGPRPGRAPRSLRAPQDERPWVKVLVWIAFAVLSTMMGAVAYRSFFPAPPPEVAPADDVRRLGPPAP